MKVDGKDTIKFMTEQEIDVFKSPGMKLHAYENPVMEKSEKIKPGRYKAFTDNIKVAPILGYEDRKFLNSLEKQKKKNKQASSGRKRVPRKKNTKQTHTRQKRIPKYSECSVPSTSTKPSSSKNSRTQNG